MTLSPEKNSKFPVQKKKSWSDEIVERVEGALYYGRLVEATKRLDDDFSVELAKKILKEKFKEKASSLSTKEIITTLLRASRASAVLRYTSFMDPLIHRLAVNEYADRMVRRRNTNLKKPGKK